MYDLNIPETLKNGTPLLSLFKKVKDDCTKYKNLNTAKNLGKRIWLYKNLNLGDINNIGNNLENFKIIPNIDNNTIKKDIKLSKIKKIKIDDILKNIKELGILLSSKDIISKYISDDNKKKSYLNLINLFNNELVEIYKKHAYNNKLKGADFKLPIYALFFPKTDTELMNPIEINEFLKDAYINFGGEIKSFIIRYDRINQNKNNSRLLLIN